MLTEFGRSIYSTPDFIAHDLVQSVSMDIFKSGVVQLFNDARLSGTGIQMVGIFPFHLLLTVPKGFDVSLIHDVAKQCMGSIGDLYPYSVECKSGSVWAHVA